MITYTKKIEPKPATEENEQNRFENIHKEAAEQRRKADIDGTRLRARQPRVTASYETGVGLTAGDGCLSTFRSSRQCG